MGTEWKTISVMACQTEKGDRISVIEQRQREMGAPTLPPKTRYVLGNGQEVMRLHGSSFINLQSGEEYIRQPSIRNSRLKLPEFLQAETTTPAQSI